MIVNYLTDNSYDTRAEAKQLFHDWLDNFDATNDEEQLFDALADREDWLPDWICENLGLPFRSSYANAVQVMRSQWIAD